MDRILLITLLAAAVGGCSRQALGVNLGTPPDEPRERFYGIERILDLADIFTLSASAGWGLSAEAHVTRALALGVGVRSHLLCVGLGPSPRSLLFGLREDLEVAAGPIAFGLAATMSPGNTHSYSTFLLQRPRERIYQELRDYCGVGGHLFLLVVGIEAEIHPVQIGDFLAGFVGIDFLEDDPPGAHRRRDRLEGD